MTQRIGDLGSRVLLLTSLRMETRAVERGVARWRLRPGIVQIGMGQRHAEEASQRALIEHRPEFVVALGFAGSLSLGLRVGDVFESDTICDESGNLGPSPACIGISASRVLLLSACEPAATAEGKSRLAAATGAATVDMESLAIAQVCARANVAFAVVRAISDSHDEGLPPDVLGWTDERGEVRTFKAIRTLATRPWLLPSVMRLARDARRAAKALTRAAEELGEAATPPRVAIE